MENIYVTKSFLPPIEEYEAYLAKIWNRGVLTNQGPLLQEFEHKLRNYLEVENFHFLTNGTVALQLALRAFGITEGEVITTPFSYVATTSSILWERCKPVFVDIDQETYCIDPDKIEAAITKETKAIMAVHVFGFPCNVEKIEAIAQRHKLKVIYDGAHAFGVKYNGRSLLSFGDAATCSFHATKLFHTIEGGCLITAEKTASDKVELMKRFGHQGDDHHMLGINAKGSEFQAAMGLCNLPHVPEIIRQRKAIFDLYNAQLHVVRTPTIPKNIEYNYIYYPVTFKSEIVLLKVLKALNEDHIFPRRYFYPSLNLLPYLDSTQSCPVSEKVAQTVLCLPLYAGLAIEDAERITKIINVNAT